MICHWVSLAFTVFLAISSLPCPRDLYTPEWPTLLLSEKSQRSWLRWCGGPLAHVCTPFPDIFQIHVKICQTMSNLCFGSFAMYINAFCRVLSVNVSQINMVIGQGNIGELCHLLIPAGTRCILLISTAHTPN